MDRMARIESVQNASDHARTLAKSIAGESGAFNALPWFWSDLGSIRLQIAGVLTGADRLVTRGSPYSGAFSVFGFSKGTLTGVETINRPADHLLARRLLAAPILPTIEEIERDDIPLKALLGKASAATPIG
jgi:3-phenylpropionate/trans-cinnamate dioxygenase ferredoxin reductase subunit